MENPIIIKTKNDIEFLMTKMDDNNSNENQIKIEIKDDDEDPVNDEVSVNDDVSVNDGYDHYYDDDIDNDDMDKDKPCRGCGKGGKDDICCRCDKPINPYFSDDNCILINSNCDLICISVE